ncbi:MAG: site-2 protease family protein [Bacillota bacterium]|nr:site-2 protease family protein [Bacillota bacterium]
MNSSFRIMQIKGIPVEINISWLLIFFLFSLTLAQSYFPSVVAGLSSSSYWAAGIITTLVLFASVLTHEFGHSIMAIKEGIPIKKITLFIFGGVAQMESEPTSPATEFKVTAAGPLTSLFIALVFGAFYYLILSPGNIYSEAIFFVAQLNLIMAVFNLVPAFPLDGGRIFRSIVWYFNKNMLTATRISVGLGSVLSYLAMAIGFLQVFFQGNLFGLWLIFLGWMINQAGQSSYSQLVFKETFSGMKVSELMSTNLQTVSPDDTLEELAECFLHYKFGAFPVVYGSTTHGLVTLQNMKEIPREQWAETKISRVLTPLKDVMVLTPGTDAAEVMMKMAIQNTGRALVMNNGELVGLLSRTDMMRFMQMHMVLGSD